MKIRTLLISLIVILAACNNSTKVATLSSDEINEYWKTGKTLPVEVTNEFPLPEQELENDNGINVLVDLAHDCSFATLWNLQERLNKMGFRTAGSHATINTVLDLEGFSRVRIPFDTINKVFPFAWWPNAEYNVIITEQNSLKSQEYTAIEIQALVNFVKNGGGLLIQGKAAQKVRREWSLNTLCAEFGVLFTTKSVKKRWI